MSFIHWTAGLAGATSTLGFAPHAEFATGTNPSFVAMADFNGDHHGDMVVANAGAGTVSVLIGNGHGSFLPRNDFVVGNNPQFVAAADLNNDGAADIVTANYGANTVSILIGNGLGGFAPKLDIATGVNPRSVAIADLNGDDQLDLAVANYHFYSGGWYVSILLGNGDGTFGPRTDVGVSANSLLSIAAGDLNRDGNIDLAVTNLFNPWLVTVLLGSGNGTFPSQIGFSVDAGPYSIAIGDLNSDDNPDVVTFDYFGQHAEVLLGNGDGSLQPSTPFATGPNPSAVAIVDVDLDGVSDMVVANSSTNTVSALPGNGAGGFGNPIDLLTSNGPGSMVVGDFNDDGRPDIATTHSASNFVSLLLNTTLVAVGPISPDPADSSFAWSSRAVCGSGPCMLEWGANALQFAAGTFAVPESVTVRGLPSNGFGFDDDAQYVSSTRATREWVEIVAAKPSAEAPDSIFDVPGTLTVVASDSAMAGIDKTDNLAAYWFDPTQQVWSQVAGASLAQNAGGNVVATVPIRRPGVYAIGGTMLSTVDVPDGNRIDYSLAPVYPNPSNGGFTIDFVIGQESDIDLSVYDVAGRHVAKLAGGTFRPGRYRAAWNATSNGQAVKAGLYFIRLKGAGKTRLQPVSVLR